MHRCSFNKIRCFLIITNSTAMIFINLQKHLKSISKDKITFCTWLQRTSTTWNWIHLFCREESIEEGVAPYLKQFIHTKKLKRCLDLYNFNGIQINYFNLQPKLFSKSANCRFWLWNIAPLNVCLMCNRKYSHYNVQNVDLELNLPNGSLLF